MRHLVLILMLASLAHAQATTQPATKPVQRRPGFRIIDGYWAKPQAKIKMGDLLKVVDENGKHQLHFQPAVSIEPMLRNGRTCVVEIEGSDFAWKLTSPNRVWNENHTEGTQQLELVAATDEMKSGTKPAITKISIRPDVTIIQAIKDEENQTRSIILVMNKSYVELAVTPAGQVAADQIFRATTARLMLRDHPIEARAYLIPLLQLVANDPAIMQPAAGDVYRAFPDLPADTYVSEVLGKIIADLSDPDPKFRARAMRDLNLLGRRGVQSAMRVDLSKIPPESADRLTTYIHENTHDPRPADQLRIDSNFLLDCLADPDPAVRKTAGECVETITKTSH